jgi:hypothetical protein
MPSLGHCPAIENQCAPPTRQVRKIFAISLQDILGVDGLR